MDKSSLVIQLAELLAIYAEIESMKALNVYRAHRGEAISYLEEEFCRKAREARSVADYINRYK